MRFDHAIENAVANCDVLLALIGPRWLSAQGDAGRRLDAPNDFVRLEIAAALRREVMVIPVLLDGATIPNANELPSDLAKLALHQAVSIGKDDWPRQMARVERSIQSVMKLRSPGDGRKIGSISNIARSAARHCRRSAAPKGWRQALFGGFTCPQCGTNLDRLARVIR